MIEENEITFLAFDLSLEGLEQMTGDSERDDWELTKNSSPRKNMAYTLLMKHVQQAHSRRNYIIYPNPTKRVCFFPTRLLPPR